MSAPTGAGDTAELAEAARRWVVRVEGLLPLPNRTNTLPLRARISGKRRWREAVASACLGERVPPLGRARVVVTRHSAGVPDPDALPAAAKPVLDGLVCAGVVPDDSVRHLRAEYRAAPAPRGRAWLELVIEPAAD